MDLNQMTGGTSSTSPQAWGQPSGFLTQQTASYTPPSSAQLPPLEPHLSSLVDSLVDTPTNTQQPQRRETPPNTNTEISQPTMAAALGADFDVRNAASLLRLREILKSDDNVEALSGLLRSLRRDTGGADRQDAPPGFSPHSQQTYSPASQATQPPPPPPPGSNHHMTTTSRQMTMNPAAQAVAGYGRAMTAGLEGLHEREVSVIDYTGGQTMLLSRQQTQPTYHRPQQQQHPPMQMPMQHMAHQQQMMEEKKGEKEGVAREVRRMICYKTKMCPWYPLGKCWRGDQCNFAHVHEELRPGLADAKEEVRTRNPTTSMQPPPPPPGYQNAAQLQKLARASTTTFKETRPDGMSEEISLIRTRDPYTPADVVPGAFLHKVGQQQQQKRPTTPAPPPGFATPTPAANSGGLPPLLGPEPDRSAKTMQEYTRAAYSRMQNQPNIRSPTSGPEGEDALSLRRGGGGQTVVWGMGKDEVLVQRPPGLVATSPPPLHSPQNVLSLESLLAGRSMAGTEQAAEEYQRRMKGPTSAETLPVASHVSSPPLGDIDVMSPQSLPGEQASGGAEGPPPYSPPLADANPIEVVSLPLLHDLLAQEGKKNEAAVTSGVSPSVAEQSVSRSASHTSATRDSSRRGLSETSLPAVPEGELEKQMMQKQLSKKEHAAAKSRSLDTLELAEKADIEALNRVVIEKLSGGLQVGTEGPVDIYASLASVLSRIKRAKRHEFLKRRMMRFLAAGSSEGIINHTVHIDDMPLFVTGDAVAWPITRLLKSAAKAEGMPAFDAPSLAQYRFADHELEDRLSPSLALVPDSSVSVKSVSELFRGVLVWTSAMAIVGRIEWHEAHQYMQQLTDILLKSPPSPDPTVVCLYYDQFFRSQAGLAAPLDPETDFHSTPMPTQTWTTVSQELLRHAHKKAAAVAADSERAAAPAAAAAAPSISSGDNRSSTQTSPVASLSAGRDALALATEVATEIAAESAAAAAEEPTKADPSPTEAEEAIEAARGDEAGEVEGDSVVEDDDDM
ncbi:unnamed protein product [Vitrella brassicaformis CCMP3155]|uniref:C3H1-type domain-containing protein n=2 Tax=Vitrella brassicaformis TaxID=1169539 RepID=A0A0G4EXR9_VITBC|nr:unnamed protein product [Vitrella brassicaformis CCMP3155]|mmetsp:Transcript_19284/g.46567  ORF Transcript_19284/g.46567 Transcript_19284/m.46567 type:complete len:1015 (+) Transcript_19284:55-3099(+)|eukprot:CEM03409.1 unnamed protein product [Vitrella brassicaformis CCMP3155]